MTRFQTICRKLPDNEGKNLTGLFVEH